MHPWSQTANTEPNQAGLGHCPIAVFKNLDMADPSRPSVPAVTLLEHHPGYHCLPGLVCYRFRIKIGTSWLCFARALCQRDQTPLTVLVAILHAKILSHLFHVLAHLLPSISWAPHLAFTNTLANSLTITCQSFPAFSSAVCFGLINRCLLSVCLFFYPLDENAIFFCLALCSSKVTLCLFSA